MAVAYRLWQFWRNLTAVPLSLQEMAEITAVLTPDELALFQRFSLSDQQHSYCVLGTLQRAGYTQPVLQKAALLHDIGKIRYRLTIWERSLAVLLGMLWSRRVDAWGQGEARGWQRPFVIKAQHPVWGADMVNAVGGEAVVVSLIRRHQDVVAETAEAEEDKLLRLLQWADDQN